MKRALTETSRYPYVDEAGFKHITEKREDLGDLLRRSGPAVQIDEGTAYWWTFAGGRVNHTLKYGFEVLEGRGRQLPAPHRGRWHRARVGA